MAAKKQNKDTKNTASYGKQKRLNPSDSKLKKDNNSIIDSRAKTDILAVVLIVVGIALFTVSLIPTNAPVTSLIVNILKFVFGLGIFVFPVFLIICGGSFFFRMERQKITARVSIGLCLIFVAVLGIISLCSPTIAANKPEGLFAADNIINYGGIIGSSIAWLGYTLFGNVVSIILMSGLIVVGMIIIGLSITKIVSRINERREDIERLKEAKRTAKVVAGNNNENLDDQQTQAIMDNAGKKAGLKTRILGFRNTEKPVSDQFEFDPTQSQTRMLSKSADQESKIPSTKEANKKTKLISNEDLSDKASNKKSSTKDTFSASVSTPKPLEGFVLPSFDILETQDEGSRITQSDETLKNTAQNLQKTLAEFGISANVVGWVPGPTVTLFKVDLPAGVRVSRITALNDDIALALAAPGVRVFAPIPGTTYVGIEVPNDKRQTVLLSEVLSEAKTGPLQMAIGKDVEGNAIITDLAKMPHLLIGGTTGSGKSVSINAMIMSILMRATPSEVRLILIDPKRVEFTPYNDIPHLYVPVVTEPKEAASALSWGVAEMENRLKTFSENKVRNIGAYNSMVQKMTDKKKEELGLSELPYIVIVIDELADLMMAVGKEVEFSISRIAQLARAAGIHLIVATQRPSTNVVTGLIKANITNRIAFNVASGIDSRVILDTGGAESLIGLGDMLFNKPEFSKPLRVQGCYVSENEVASLVKHLKDQGKPEYHNDILKTSLINVGDSSSSNYSNGGDDDTLFWEAAEMIVNAQHGSTSSLQRRFKIGYARAGRIMDMLEEKGIVGPQNGSKPREVLVDASELEGIKALEGYDGEQKSDTSKKTQVLNDEEVFNESEQIEDMVDSPQLIEEDIE